jgi:outer membrane protein TolC
LRLGTTTNLDIAFARATLDLARASRQRADSRILPNVGTGATYVDHDGRIQQANGNILNVNRTSLAVGVTPTLSLDFADAIFLPLAARQLEQSALAATVRTTNDTAVAIADAYLAVLRGQRRLERVNLVLSYLTDEKPAPQRSDSKGLYPLVRDVVESGGKDAFRSDLARLKVEVIRRNEERTVIEQDLRVASAELARLLRLDPQTRFSPVEDRWAAVPLPGADWLKLDVGTLITFALGNRPEITEAEALARYAVERERGARYRPYLPVVQVAYFAGGFGGGPLRDPRSKITQDLNGPIDKPVSPTDEIGRFGHRSDLALTLGWQLQGFGLGNVAEIREARAVHTQAEIRLLSVRERVSAQVVQAHAAVVQNLERLWTSWEALADKNGKPAGPVYESLRLNFARFRGGEGRPLEALESIRGLNDILEGYANGLSDYDRTHVRLLLALGLPAAALYNPECMPPPPQVSTTPVRRNP